MSSKRSALQTLVRSGMSGVQLIRNDPTGPVGKYMASIKINGQYLCGFNCCVLCKELLKTGKNYATHTWRHKTRHLSAGAKYSDKELEERIRSFNNHNSQSNQEVIPTQFQFKSTNEPLHNQNFANMPSGQEGIPHQYQFKPNNAPCVQLNCQKMQPFQDNEIPNETLGQYVLPAEDVIKFKHPTTIMIAGPTFSGKTTFVKRMLHEDMIEPSPQRIIWIYKEKGDQSEFAKLNQEFPQVEFLSDLDIGRIDSLDPRENNLVILDDVMSEAGDSKEVAKIFTQGAHHRNMTVIFLVQNVFQQAKQMRTISLNTHYLVLYKNPRDQSQIRVLSNQMFPGKKNFLVNVYADATKTPHSYLLIDLHPETPEEHRVRTNIFPGDDFTIYVPDDYKNPEDDNL